MRKVLLLAISVVAAIGVYAQDIIVTRDAKRIEAKILEVSSSEIKYKEFNNQSGPTFVLTSAEINTIIYQNGTVKVFDQPKQQAPAYGNSASQAAAVSAPAGAPITKSDDFYYMGEQRMTEDQYVAFIQKNCTQAYDAFKSGEKLQKTGWKLFASGLPILSVGAILYGVGLGVGQAERDEDIILGCGIPGAILLGVGSGLTVASIPCIVVGSVKKNNSHEVYNASCARPTALEFNINAKGTGIGFAMKF